VHETRVNAKTQYLNTKMLHGL